jgi:hypothetical protein
LELKEKENYAPDKLTEQPGSDPCRVKGGAIPFDAALDVILH